MKNKLSVVALSAIFLGACASQPEKIQSGSVSTLQYEDYNCKQISMELARVNDRANALYSSLKKKADDDTAQMAVGMILFWPALFFLEGGDGPEAAEYSKLKGERDALEKVSIQKQCGVQTAGAPTNPAPLTNNTEPPAASSGEPVKTNGAPVATTAANASSAKTGKYWFNAAQFGRTQECEPTAPPLLITETAEAEVYQLGCKEKAMPMVVKCSSENCNGI